MDKRFSAVCKWANIRVLPLPRSYCEILHVREHINWRNLLHFTMLCDLLLHHKKRNLGQLRGPVSF